MENEIVQLPLKIVNDVLTYLGTRPYSEVAGLINAVVNGVNDGMPQAPPEPMPEKENVAPEPQMHVVEPEEMKDEPQIDA